MGDNKTGFSSILVSILLLSFLMIPLATAMAQGFGSQQIEQPTTARQMMDYFVGSWQTSYQYLSFGLVTEHSTYFRGSDPNSLSVQVQIMKSGVQLDGGTGTMRFDPQNNTISTTITTQNGMQQVQTREVQRQGNVVWFEGTGGQTMPRFRLRMEFINRNSFNWTIYAPAGADWRAVNSVVYQRVQQTGIPQ